MPLIIDPDNLNQGDLTAVSDAVWTGSVGSSTTITSAGTNLPALATNEFFEIRGHSESENNGLYQATGTPTTGSVDATKITGSDPIDALAEAVDVLGTTGAASEKSIHVDTDARRIHLLEQGNLSVDGVTIQTIYSFLKEEWKNDATLIPFTFPMVAITPEQFEHVDGWRPVDDNSRRLIRTGGWREIDSSSNILREYAGIITLGTFEDQINDLAYYQQGTDPTNAGAITDFQFAGPVNEAVLIFDENVIGSGSNTITFADGGGGDDTITRSTGSFITDGYTVGARVVVRNANTAGNNGTYEITAVTATVLDVQALGGGDAGLAADADTQAILGVDYRSSLSLFLRVRDGDPNGKTFAQATNTDIGVPILQNQAYRFPLSNATDLKIEETDANIDSQSPYTEIFIRYLDEAYNREVDSGVKRDFGVIIDVGTYSHANGVSNGTTLFTSASLGDITLGDYTGGTLTIHEGTDQGTYTIVGTPVDNAGTLEVTLSGSLTGSETNLSFTLQRATPVTATAEEIYEKVQRQLRLASDIDGTTDVVIGRIADELLTFVGDTLQTGATTPNNPNGGGSGVFIEGFSSNDTNRLEFTDNAGTVRTFPFVAAGTISFNSNLVSDSTGCYWMFYEYTTRTTVSDLTVGAPTGNQATITSAGSELPVLADQDHVNLQGFANEAMNGIWRAVGAGTAASVTLLKLGDSITIDTEGPLSVTVDENPLNSPDAILVQDNNSMDITGPIGASSISFDFDYDGNTQGGRVAGTDAPIILRAIGFETAQFVETTGTIVRATGQSFSLVAGLERNYANPA